MNIRSATSIYQKFFSKGHERTVKAKKNILFSFGIKGLNIALGLILVPITIHYLNPTKYGIWITLSSVIGWFGFFDIGLGHGFRNRFAEALAREKYVLARTYVSTTYAILSLIIGGVLCLYYLINPLLNWGTILNAQDKPSLSAELNLLALIVFTFFCLRFVFNLITTILIADQRPAMASLFDLFGKGIALLIIFILTKFTHGSLLYLGMAMSGAPLVVLMVSTIWFYTKKYSYFRPSLRFVDFGKAKDLLNLGVKFFIIQIASVLLYQTNNMIISHLFGPAQVAPYHIAFKYFSILPMGFSIILTPFWSAFTQAWAVDEMDWIKNIMRKLIQLWILLSITGLGMLMISPWIYRIWVGNKVTIPFTISLLVGLTVIASSWNSIFSYFLNGVGKIQLQLYLGILAALFNVPLAIFAGTKLGMEGILFANIIVLLPSVVVYYIQFKKLVNQSATGVFNA